MTIIQLFHLFISWITLVYTIVVIVMDFRDLFFYRQEYIFIVNETVFEVKILNGQSLHVYRPKQLSVMQDFFVCFELNLMT